MANERIQAALELLVSFQSEPWFIYGAAQEGLMQAALHCLQSGGEMPTLADYKLDFASKIGAAYQSQMKVIGGKAIIPVVGAIQPEENNITRWWGGTSCTAIRNDSRSAMNDDDVEEVIYFFNTPGGSAFGVDNTAAAIAEVGKRKPTTGFIGGMCASAGYYLLAPCKRSVAEPDSVVGSIGAKMVHADIAAAYKHLWGMDITVFTSGQYKADYDGLRALTKQSRATNQELIEQFGSGFRQAIARYKGVTEKQVIERYGDGKVFIATNAVKLGLIDAVGSLDLLKGRTTETQSAADDGDDADEVPEASVAFGVPSEKSKGSSSDNKTPGRVVVSTNNQSSGGQVKTEKRKMQKIIALMFGLDLLTSQEVEESVVLAAFNAWCKAKNVDEIPDPKTDAGEAAAIKLLQAAASGGKVETTTKPAETTTPATNPVGAQAAKDQETAELKQEFKNRKAELVAAAELININRSTAVVTTEMILAEVDSDNPITTVQQNWTKTINENSPETPLALARVEFGEAAQDRFGNDAVLFLMQRSGYAPSANDSFKGNPRELANMGLIGMAERTLQMQQIDTSLLNDEQIAKKALALGPHEHTEIGSEMSGYGISAEYNQPGDFAWILGGYGRRFMDRAIPLAESTYPDYCDKMDDATNFKPTQVIAVGEFSYMDAIKGTDKYKELKIKDEENGWIRVERRGNAVGLTPLMVANDDLDGFRRALRSLVIAHENTLNSICLGIITGNIAMADGNALYDNANHFNVVNPGASPSADQATLMDEKIRTQKGIGTDRAQRAAIKKVLVPVKQREKAIQTFARFNDAAVGAGESKRAEVDSNLNIHRGKVDVVVEPDLDAHSTSKWYGFADPMVIRTIGYQFMVGYGRGGQRIQWFDVPRNTRWFGLEGRFGAAGFNWRGTVRNDGGG